MFLQVNVLVDDSAAAATSDFRTLGRISLKSDVAPLPRRPIFGRLAGYRLKSGRCASSG